MVAAAVVFCAPLAIWLRFSREIAGAGGLYTFVEAAVGRRVALLQAAVWAFSYLLYLIYTTVQIVYDLLPVALPGARNIQTLLALMIPLALAVLVTAGRFIALLVLGVIAVGQVVLGIALDWVTLAHVSLPASSFGVGAPTGALAQAGAQTSLLYVCGSLPLFLGGELSNASATVRRGLSGALVLTGLIVLLAVAPLATMPALTHTAIPGMAVMRRFADDTWASAIGIGVAASTAGLIVWEYVALTRLAYAVGGWRLRPVSAVIGLVMVLAAPVSLIDPEGFYTTLLKPSIIGLWVSQLIVFLCYPLFMRRRGQLRATSWLLAACATALAGYGLWLAV